MFESSPPFALSSLQREVINALATGVTVSAAAEAAGIHRSTVHNWIRNIAAFSAALREGQHQIAQIIEDRLRELSTSALALIESYITDDKAPASIRLRAALAVVKAAAAADPFRRPISGTRLSQSGFDRLFEAACYQAADESAFRAGEVPPAEAPNPETAAAQDTDLAAAHLIPRGGPCPCGSGDKYKRCCGKDAPPVLGPPPPRRVQAAAA